MSSISTPPNTLPKSRMGATGLTPYHDGVSALPLEWISRRMLAGTQGADRWLASQAAKNPNALQTLWNKRIHWALSKLGSWDVNGYPLASIPGYRHFFGDITMARAPMSVVFCWLYVITFPYREYLAIKRQQPGDLTKEIADVAVRDMTSFALLLFILDPTVRSLNKHLFQKLAQLPLVKGETLSYSEMKKSYIIESANQLRTLAADPATRNGLQKAVNELSDRGLSQQGYTNLQKHIAQFKQQVKQLLAKPQDAGIAQQAFNTLQGLDSHVIKAGQQAFETGNSPLATLANKVRSGYQYPQFLSYYANRFRVPADLLSLAAVIGLAGWLPMYLNDLMSRKAVKQFKKSHTKHESTPAGTLPAAQQENTATNQPAAFTHPRLNRNNSNSLVFSAFKTH
jgi:hypothetical protein